MSRNNGYIELGSDDEPTATPTPASLPAQPTATTTELPAILGPILARLNELEERVAKLESRRRKQPQEPGLPDIEL